MGCLRCGKEDVKLWQDGMCSFCGINEGGFPGIVGLDYATKGRVDRINSQRDTLRALEMAASGGGHKTPRASRADFQRWAEHARTLDDRSYKYDPDSAGQPAGAFPATSSQVSEARRAEGEIKDFWAKCKYERNVLRQKPKTDIQAANYALVDKSGEA